MAAAYCEAFEAMSSVTRGSQSNTAPTNVSTMMILIVVMITLTTTVGYYAVNFASPSSSPIVTASLRSQTSNYLVNSSITCTLDNVRSGDVLFAAVQTSAVPGTGLSVSDTAGDSYTYLQDWDHNIGTGGAYANASSSGSIG
jgi:hypothetical protein